MSPELVQCLCRMNAYLATVEGMKADNRIAELQGRDIVWSGDHFYSVATDLETMASHAGSLMP